MSTAPHPDIIIPVIHLNGDRAATLKHTLEEAYKAVRQAEKALAECHPNGRNFYLVDGLLSKAQAQHGRRMATLKNLEKELLTELRGIEAQER